MSSLKKIRSSIQSHQAMKSLIEVYEEMAANAMKDIRDSILASREYYHGLAKLSAEVGADLASVDEIKSKPEALVLLSADEGLYGDITDSVFSNFLQRVRTQHRGDIYISGRIGQELMRVVAPEIKFQPLEVIDLDDENLLAALGEKLWKYKQVEVYFGQFASIARQEPSSRTLSLNQLNTTQDEWAGEIIGQLKYLYEPSAQQISNKFSKGIFVGVLQQTIKEDELAKNASRLMHLDKALNKIEDNLDKDERRFHKSNKRRISKKQQLQLAGYKALKNRKANYV